MDVGNRNSKWMSEIETANGCRKSKQQMDVGNRNSKWMQEIETASGCRKRKQHMDDMLCIWMQEMEIENGNSD